MAIQPLNTGIVANTAPQTKSANKNTVDLKNQAANPIASDDTVSITSTAKDIKNASGSGSTSPEVNEAQVAELKSVLQEGNYKIDPDRVAEKMMQLDKMLPNTT